jgi:1,2-diacylglycerol 3-alpha-glucosyltransferase
MQTSKPLTIVIASESFYPVISGVAVMTERLAHYLSKQGHTVVVITPSRSHREYQERRRGYTVQRIPSWRSPFRKDLRITFFPNKVIKTILDRIKPDIIHIHDPWITSSLIVGGYGHKNGIPVVVTHHFSFDFMLSFVPFKGLHEQIRPILEKAVAQLYMYCNLLTVPTETMRGLLAHVPHDLPVRVVSNGVDIKRFSQKVSTESFLLKHRILQKVPIITSLGRMDSEKNLGLLLEALALVKARGIQFHSLLVGNGSEREQLMEQAKELGLEKQLTWIVRIDNQSPQLVQLLAASSIFCIPSPIETESMVTMEAMAAGLPILAANEKALKELVTNGENGYSLPADDPQAWADALTVLINDSALCKKMGSCSQELITPRDVSKTLPEFEAIYRELLNASKES